MGIFEGRHLALAAPARASRAAWPVRALFWIALVASLKAAEALLLPVVVAVVLTFVLATPVRWLRRRGIPETAGAALLVGTLLGGAGLLGSMLAEPAAQWWQRAPTALEQALKEFDRVRARIPLLAPRPIPRSNRAAAAAAAAQPDPVKDQIANEGMLLTRAVLAHFLSFAVSAAATIILLYFLLASEHWMLSRTVEAIPRRRVRALVLAGVRSAQRDTGRYLGTLTLINAGVGLVATAALAALDVPNPVLWGTVAAVLNFIPYLGPMMVVALLGLVGLFTFGLDGPMLLPPLAFLLIHAVESNLVTPWLVGMRLVLSPLAVFVSVMFWGWLWGIAGALVAVPLLLVLRSVCKRNRRLRLWCVYLEGGHRAPPSLRSLMRRRPSALAGPAPGRLP